MADWTNWPRAAIPTPDIIDDPPIEEWAESKIIEDRKYRRGEKGQELYPNYFVADQIPFTIDVVRGQPERRRKVDEGKWYAEVEPAKHFHGRLGMRDGCIVDGQVELMIYYGHGIDSARTQLFYINGTCVVTIINPELEEEFGSGQADEEIEHSFMIEVENEKVARSEDGVVGNPRRLELELFLNDSPRPKDWSVELSEVEWS